jgi:uncharacterized protein (DUF1330 family)
MPSIHPAREALLDLTRLPDSDPVVMLNMLRFRAQAEYPDGSGHAPCSGREAYRRYTKEATRHFEPLGGRLVWLGQVERILIGPEQEFWDEVFLAQYPSRRAFIRMVSDPDYIATTVHRTAALADSRLIAMRAAQTHE